MGCRKKVPGGVSGWSPQKLRIFKLFECYAFDYWLKWPLCKKSAKHRMTASTHFENCNKYCVWASIEQTTAKRAEVGPIIPRAVRAEIVHVTRINYHVAEEEPLFAHIQQSRNLKVFRGNTPGSPASGSGSNRRRGKGSWRKDRWRNGRGKGSEMEYLKFSTPYLLTIYRNFHNSDSSWQAEAISRKLWFNPILLQHVAAYITDCTVRTLWLFYCHFVQEFYFKLATDS